MKLCDLTMPEIRFYLRECNFTKEERAVFEFLASGETVEFTAEKLNVGVSTAKRIKNRIWTKIERLKGL